MLLDVEKMHAYEMKLKGKREEIIHPTRFVSDHTANPSRAFSSPTPSGPGRGAVELGITLWKVLVLGNQFIMYAC